jgi:hypothetical protein
MTWILIYWLFCSAKWICEGDFGVLLLLKNGKSKELTLIQLFIFIL